MLVRVFDAQFCARDRGCGAHPVFPAPSDFEGKVFLQNSGRIALRECGHMSISVIASEAKQSIPPRKERMDCFASLAMTWRRTGSSATILHHRVRSLRSQIPKRLIQPIERFRQNRTWRREVEAQPG